MNINITKEEVGYSAVIKDYRIVTQGNSFDELILNLSESLSLYNEGDKLKHFSDLKNFNLVI